MATNESREDLEKQLADLAAIAPNQNFGMDTRVPMVSCCWDGQYLDLMKQAAISRVLISRSQ